MTLLFIATWVGAAVPPPDDFDAMRGVVTMGPRITANVSVGVRMEGTVDTGPSITGTITILPG